MALYNFYRSKEWEGLRALLINERVNDSGFVICEHCGKPIVKAYDIIAHHVIELTEENYYDASISLNPENIMLVHHRCHNFIHGKLSYSGRQVFVVYGSPLSGKSSFVKETMLEGDLIIDVDRIWYCVSGCPEYVKPNRLKSVVFATRDNLLESVKYRRGKWLNAYIIGGYPYQAERARLLDTLGAREIHVDTPKEVCLQRLADCQDGRDKAEWSKYIEQWWQQYEGGY